jgi:hypothetical protein
MLHLTYNPAILPLTLLSLIALSAFSKPADAYPAPSGHSTFSSSLSALYTDFNHDSSSFLPRSKTPSSHSTSMVHVHAPNPASNPHSHSVFVPSSNTEPHYPLRGNIKMGSQKGHQIPLSFSLSPTTCKPLASECTCLIADLEDLLLTEYSNGITFPCLRTPIPVVISETVTIAMNGIEYRATVEIKLWALEKGVKGMETAEWRALLGLLGHTAEAIERGMVRDGMVDGDGGFGRVVVEASIEGVGVEAAWTFYEFDGNTGGERRCGN